MENFQTLDHEFFMRVALKEAEEAGKRGDRPIGAVIVHNGTIMARGSNRIHTMDNEIAHAESLAIHRCASYLKKHAKECVLYTTVEPCMMCLTTIVMANIRQVFFSIKDQYLDMDDFIESTPYIKKRLYHYQGGVLAEKSAHLLKTYSPFMAEVVLNGRKPT